MNIINNLFKTKNNNIAWKSDKPTPYVVDCFNNGLISKDNSVIDIGCGFGRNSNWLATQGASVTALNINNDEIRYAKNKAKILGVGVNYKLTDFTKFDSKGKLFDVALDMGCSHMLSIPDQYLFEKNIAKILKTGGLCIYFGFSKKHPAYDASKKRAIYRDIEDLLKIYAKDFEILSHKEHSWIPSINENSKFTKHIGLNIVMRRK